MKQLTISFLLLISANNLFPQAKLSLEDCYSKASNNYPLIKQQNYIEKSKELTVSNIWKGYFPQVTVNGQATYQSDVTSIPITLPGMNIDPLTKDQYKITADVAQTIYDGGIMAAQSNITQLTAEADKQKIEIEFHKIKERINQIYFGILLIDKQLTQTNLIKSDLESVIEKLTAALKYGTTIKSNVDLLNAELLKTEQRNIELKTSKQSFADMLGLLINQSINDNTVLSEETELMELNDSENLRPELSFYSLQQETQNYLNNLSTSKILPKASLFFQGGYGKPALNFLKNDFEWYYIAGARFTWTLSNLYSFGNERQINELNKKSIDAQKESFLLNTKMNLKQYENEINKLNELINLDKKLIEIRVDIKTTAKAQLENGIITASDFIRELNAEDLAKQNLLIHKIQLAMARQNYKLTLGQ